MLKYSYVLTWKLSLGKDLAQSLECHVSMHVALGVDF